MLKIFHALLGMLLGHAALAHAELTIEIIGAGEHQIPVAIVPLGGDAKPLRPSMRWWSAI